MSVYDNRDRPAYSQWSAPASDSKNRHILRWWTPSHDQVLAKQIQGEQWQWPWGITDALLAITPLEIIESWKATDPKCREYAWYNILMYFSISRADQLGLTKTIRQSEWKVCPMCEQRFREDSLPYPLVKMLGIDRLDFCSPCLSRAVFTQNAGNNSLSGTAIVTYLRDLASVVQRVPSQSFPGGKDDLRYLTTQERLAVLQVLNRKPSASRVKQLFGSWLKALVEAGVLEDGARRTSRGTHCLANDGHVCLSLGEKTIDDFLHSHGLSHEKEVAYPAGNFKADFATNGVFIEYFGLTGNVDYDKKTKHKQRLCKRLGITLISLYPADLASSKKLEDKLSRIISINMS